MEGGAGPRIGARPVAFQAPESTTVVDAGGTAGPRLRARTRAGGNLNVFQAAADHIEGAAGGGQARAGGQLDATARPSAWAACCPIMASPPSARVDELAGGAEAGRARVGLACLGIEHGFEAPDFAIVSEQDMLGDRMVRRAGARAPGAEFPLRGLVAGAGRSGHPYRAWRRPLSGAEDHRCAGRAA